MVEKVRILILILFRSKVAQVPLMSSIVFQNDSTFLRFCCCCSELFVAKGGAHGGMGRTRLPQSLLGPFFQFAQIQ